MRFLFSSILFSFVLALSAPVMAAEKIGVILMHGKWGTNKGKSPVVILGKALSSAGMIVLTPDMPWSKSKLYSKDYEETMNRIDGLVSSLKSKGATKIVVGGHSMGANAALGYGARRDGIAAILAIAPGHVPESASWAGKFAADVAKARKLVDAGKGDKKEKFSDINQGKKKTLNIPARVYLSWFAPDGPSPMPMNAANLKAGTALLWVTGNKDGLHQREGEAYAFAKAPPNPKSAYVVVSSGHGDAPKKSKKEIIQLLKSL
jgi:dienelactone hydrolase